MAIFKPNHILERDNTHRQQAARLPQPAKETAKKPKVTYE
jgi:hypothetical protein